MKNLWQFPDRGLITGYDFLELTIQLMELPNVWEAFMAGEIVSNLDLSKGSLHFDLDQDEKHDQKGYVFLSICAGRFVRIADFSSNWTVEEIGEILKLVGLVPAPDDADEIVD